MLQFADQFLDENIVATLSRHLSWSHFLALTPHLYRHRSSLSMLFLKFYKKFKNVPIAARNGLRHGLLFQQKHLETVLLYLQQ